MGVKAWSDVANAEYTEVVMMLDSLRRVIDEKFQQLDTKSIQNIKTRLSTLEEDVRSIKATVQAQNLRLNDLEATAANTEITAADIDEMYGGA